MNVRERLILSLLFGSVGVINSILLFLLMTNVFHLSLPVIQTIFSSSSPYPDARSFVFHTKERWYRFFPGRAGHTLPRLRRRYLLALAVSGFDAGKHFAFDGIPRVAVGVLLDANQRVYERHYKRDISKITRRITSGYFYSQEYIVNTFFIFLWIRILSRNWKRWSRK